jgi:hypothetical protein
MMEPRLAKHLFFAGIRFEQVGDVVDYHGPRAAFHITRRGLYQHLNPEVKSLLDTISAELDASEPTIDHARVQLG